MRTTSAAHTPRIPQSCSSAASEDGGAGDERADHRKREERPVARADEDPVEREDRPASGCMSAKSGHRSAVSSSTAPSPVKIRGSTPASASIATANTPPTATESQIMRAPASYARSARAAPSSLPTMI